MVSLPMTTLNYAYKYSKHERFHDMDFKKGSIGLENGLKGKS